MNSPNKFIQPTPSSIEHFANWQFHRTPTSTYIIFEDVYVLATQYVYHVVLIFEHLNGILFENTAMKIYGICINLVIFMYQCMIWFIYNITHSLGTRYLLLTICYIELVFLFFNLDSIDDCCDLFIEKTKLI